MTQPEPQFKGTWIPAFIHRLMEEKIIKPVDSILLSTIFGLTPEEGEGCWASNRYLAKKLGGVSIRWVQKTIAKLIRLRLLTSVENGKIRYLNVSFDPRKSGCAPTNNRSPPHERLFMGSSLSKERDSESTMHTTSKRLLNKSDSDMAQFRTQTKVTKSQPCDFVSAHSLHIAIQRAQRMKETKLKNPILTKWADELRKLRESLEDGDNRVPAAIEWFAENCHRKDVPTRFWAPATFRKVFSWIEQLMEKEGGPRVVVSEQAQRIAKELLMRQWPMGAAEQLPKAVQMSLDAYNAYSERLYKIHKAKKDVRDRESKRTGLTRSDFYFSLIESQLQAREIPSHFVEQWFIRIYKSVKNWKEWNGDLFALAFRIDSKHFVNHCKGKAAAYGSDLNLWDKFEKELRDAG